MIGTSETAQTLFQSSLFDILKRDMTFTTYQDACDAEVSRDEAEAEIAKHDVPGGFEQFLTDVGDKEVYLGGEVLDWLGY